MCGQTVRFRGEQVVIDDAFIDGQLGTVGSGFTMDIQVMSSPQKLCAFALKYLRIHVAQGEEFWWIDKGWCHDCTAVIDVSPAMKEAEGIPLNQKIGSCPVVLITPDIKGKVYEEPRGPNDQYVVGKIKGIPMPKTDRLIIALRWYQNQEVPRINTIYSGEPAPPFPNARQTPEEVEVYTEFWEKRAFIEE